MNATYRLTMRLKTCASIRDEPRARMKRVLQELRKNYSIRRQAFVARVKTVENNALLNNSKFKRCLRDESLNLDD
jgi:hypothetical protein